MKVLILASTFVPGNDGPVHCPEHTVIDTDRDTARRLVEAQKGLYVEKKDDHTKGGFTAEERHIRAFEEATAAAAGKAEAEAEARIPKPVKPGPGAV